MDKKIKNTDKEMPKKNKSAKLILKNKVCGMEKKSACKKK